jgi:hypothetical protein
MVFTQAGNLQQRLAGAREQADQIAFFGSRLMN